METTSEESSKSLTEHRKVMQSGIEKLRAALDKIDPKELEATAAKRDEVFDRYQRVFSPEGLKDLTADEFKSFLLMDNNKHWTGINRYGSRVVKDMDLLRRALGILLDESRPIEDRLRELRPPDGDPIVKGLGRSVITPILLVAYPDRYGVLNSVSHGAMKDLGLWPQIERGSDFATRYAKANEVLTTLADELDLDLWTLDEMWWRVETGLAKPFSDIFEDRKQAEWAFGFLGQTLELLGVEDANDPRVALTVPANTLGD